MSVSLFSELSSKFKSSFIYYDLLMKNHSSMRVGGQPAALIELNDIEDIKLTIQYFLNSKYQIRFIGKGTNIIFTDNLSDFVFLKLGESFNKIRIDNKKFICAGATPLQQAVRQSAQFGLSGLEWAIGIPGTVAGAVANNSGIKEIAITDLLKEAMVIDYTGEISNINSEELEPVYRNTRIKKERNWIILETIFLLKKKDRVEVLDSLNEYFLKKQSTQPLNEASAGCIFKNPKNISAGQLIEQAGLKTKQIGGAMISEKHANFIVNKNNATFEDIKRLIDLTRSTIAQKFNIDLELEVEIIGG